MNLIFFKQLFSDDTGAISSMRVVFVLVVLMVVATWCVLSIRQNDFVPIPPTVLGLVITAFTGKAVQSATENFSPKPQTSDAKP